MHWKQWPATVQVGLDYRMTGEPPINSDAVPTRALGAPAWSLGLLLIPCALFVVMCFLQLDAVPKFAEVARDFDLKLPPLFAWLINKPYSMVWIGTGILGIAIALTIASRSVLLRLAVSLLAALVIFVLIVAIGIALFDVSTRLASITTSGGGPAATAPSGSSTSPSP